MKSAYDLLSVLFWESYAEVFVGGFLGVNRALLPEKVSVAGSIFSITFSKTVLKAS